MAEAAEKTSTPAEPNATEAAKRKADELGVDLTKVEGSGDGGRITVEDVEDKAKPAEAEPEERRWETADAIAAGRSIAGVAPLVVAGALAGTNRETHSEGQIRQAVKGFEKETDVEQEEEE